MVGRLELQVVSTLAVYLNLKFELDSEPGAHHPNHASHGDQDRASDESSESISRFKLEFGSAGHSPSRRAGCHGPPPAATAGVTVTATGSAASLAA